MRSFEKGAFHTNLSIRRSIHSTIYIIMKTNKRITITTALLMGGLLATATAGVSQKVLDSISTPNEVETSIGTLKFFDGAPLPETAAQIYDYLDTARAIDALFEGATCLFALWDHRRLSLAWRGGSPRSPHLRPAAEFKVAVSHG